jgi:hypothetical protein
MADQNLESNTMNMHPLVSWRSVLAGVLVTFLSLAILLSLGMAFGGIGLSGGTDAQNAGVFTGVWFLVSSVISLFLGSYFAARISKFHTNRIGSAQGLVIASLFFGFFLYQTVSAVGWAGKAVGTAASGAAMAIGVGATQASDNTVVSHIVENAIGDLNLRSEPSTVVTGVGNRLVRGDTDGAKNYLARQANISPAEADRRIAALRAQLDQTMAQAREVAARTLQATGWSLFATMLLGVLSSIGGGALGTLANVRRPLVQEQLGSVSDFHTATI